MIVQSDVGLLTDRIAEEMRHLGYWLSANHQKIRLHTNASRMKNGPLIRALSAIAIPNQPLVLAVIVAAMLVEILLLAALNQILLKLRPER